MAQNGQMSGTNDKQASLVWSLCYALEIGKGTQIIFTLAA
jgi:hypothetical protein